MRERLIAVAITIGLLATAGGCPSSGGSNSTPPTPRHTTHVTPHGAFTAPPGVVPPNATGFCGDGSFTDYHTHEGRVWQCQGHGGLVEEG